MNVDYNNPDPKILTYMRALGQRESTNNPKVSSEISRREGSVGRFQYVPATFNGAAQKYFGGKSLNGQKLDINDDSHQKLVKYAEIADLKSQINPITGQKYRPDEISAIHNMGMPNFIKNKGYAKEQGAIRDWRGINSTGGKYDTLDHVRAINNYYNEYKVANPKETPRTTEVSKDEPGFFRGMAIDVTKDFENIANTATAYGGAAVSTGLGNVFGDNNKSYGDYLQYNKDTIQSPEYNSPSKFLLGDQSGQNIRDITTIDGAKQLGGDVLSAGINFAGAGVAKNVAGGMLKKTAPSTLKILGQGATLGAGQGLANSLQNNEGVSETLSNAGVGAVIGGGLGLAAPILGKVLRTGANYVNKSASELRADKLIDAIDGLRNRTQTTDNAFTKNTITRTLENGTKEKILPTDTWAKYKLEVPKVDTTGGTAAVKTTHIVEKANSLISDLDDGLIKKLNESKFTLSSDEIKKVAEKVVNAADNIDGISTGETTKKIVLQRLINNIDNLVQSNGTNWSGETIREALKGVNSVYKDKATSDVNRLLGDTMRDILYTRTEAGKPMLREMQELVTMRNFFDVLDGKKVAGGGLGRYFAQLIGGMVGGMVGIASGGGFSGLGLIIGAASGNGLLKGVQKLTFYSLPAEAKQTLLTVFGKLGMSKKEVINAVNNYSNIARSTQTTNAKANATANQSANSIISKILSQAELKSNTINKSSPQVASKSLREELLSIAKKYSDQNSNPVYTKYVADTELPVIKMGNKPKPRKSNLPTINF